MKTTRYFKHTRSRSDRSTIQDVRIVEALDSPFTSALLEFSASAVNETAEGNENIYIDLNAEVYTPLSCITH